MKCKYENDGACSILKEIVVDQCNGCAFYSQDDSEHFRKIEQSYKGCIELIDNLNREIDDLNEIILGYRKQITELEDRARSNEFKAKLFDAISKGLK